MLLLQVAEMRPQNTAPTVSAGVRTPGRVYPVKGGVVRRRTSLQIHRTFDFLTIEFAASRRICYLSCTVSPLAYRFEYRIAARVLYRLTVRG